jgi:hypothetical protein
LKNKGKTNFEQAELANYPRKRLDSQGHNPVASSTPTKWRIIPNRRLKSKKAKEKGKAPGQAVAFYFYLRLSLRTLV